MKVQCDVCEKAAATLVCCADEAALCAECDKQVHAANKLAEKHERVPFIGQQASPCDICQEKLGHFFCVEDRALLCRDCDVSIHTANKLVEKHKRFLVMGVRVGLDAMVTAQAATVASPAAPRKLHKNVCTSLEAANPKTKIAKAATETRQQTQNVSNRIANSGISTASETRQQSRNVSNPHQGAMWQGPPSSLAVCKANPTQSFQASMQTLKPIISLSPHHLQLTSAPSSLNVSDGLVHLNELLSINTNATTTFNETPSRISIPSLGWENLANYNALAWQVDAANASPYFFEESLAEVPSTPSPPVEYQASLKRKRSIDYEELIYSTFDHTSLQVPNSIFPPSFKESNICFYGGGGR